MTILLMPSELQSFKFYPHTPYSHSHTTRYIPAFSPPIISFCRASNFLNASSCSRRMTRSSGGGALSPMGSLSSEGEGNPSVGLLAPGVTPAPGVMPAPGVIPAPDTWSRVGDPNEVSASPGRRVGVAWAPVPWLPYSPSVSVPTENDSCRPHPQLSVHTYIHDCLHVCVHTHVHNTHTRIHTYTHAYTHIHMHTCMHTRMYRCCHHRCSHVTHLHKNTFTLTLPCTHTNSN